MSWIDVDFYNTEGCERRNKMCLICPHTKVILTVDKRDWEPPMEHRCHHSRNTVCRGSMVTGMCGSQLETKESLEDL